MKNILKALVKSRGLPACSHPGMFQPLPARGLCVLPRGHDGRHTDGNGWTWTVGEYRYNPLPGKTIEY